MTPASVSYGMIDLASAVDPQLDQILRLVQAQGPAELILLFGSRANGEARDDSDYDLMVVIRDESAVEPMETAIKGALSAHSIQADVLVRSVALYERRQDDPGFMDFMIARQGKLIYGTGRVPQRNTHRRVREAESEEGLAMWIERADADLRVAEITMEAAQPVWDAICFHSHAYAEKILKAMIVKNGSFPPKTHSLTHLLSLQPTGLAGDPELKAACDALMELFEKARYPLMPMPTPDEARTALAAARSVRDRIKLEAPPSTARPPS